jgi:hypothetical protein
VPLIAWLIFEQSQAMAIPEPEMRACLKAAGEFIEKIRPPLDIREDLDYRADIKGSELVIASVRPSFQDKRRKTEGPVAKAKWIGAEKVWRLYWMRADLKWHSYEPLPEARSIDVLLNEVRRDPHGCFFG